jgi:hypothetical protein
MEGTCIYCSCDRSTCTPTVTVSWNPLPSSYFSFMCRFSFSCCQSISTGTRFFSPNPNAQILVVGRNVFSTGHDPKVWEKPFGPKAQFGGVSRPNNFFWTTFHSKIILYQKTFRSLSA